MSQEDRIAAGREVELRHQEILDAWAKAGSPERVRELMGNVIALRRDYTTRELIQLGIRIPADLNPTRPEHAIVLAVRNDMIDTERRMDQAIQQQKWGGTKDAPAVNLDPSTRLGVFDQVNEFLRKLGTVGKIVVVGAVVYFAREIWLAFKRRSS